jgi:hypothetical protein
VGAVQEKSLSCRMTEDVDLYSSLPLPYHYHSVIINNIISISIYLLVAIIYLGCSMHVHCSLSLAH